MLILPFLFGMFYSKPVILHLPLFIFWLLVYFFTFLLLKLVKTRKTAYYRKPLLIYGLLLIPFGAILLYASPSLIWFGLSLFPLFFINCYYAKINRERALLNDLVAVLMFNSMVFVAYYVGGGEDWQLALQLFFIGLLFFIGTVFYVKTMIREKGNKVFYALSIGYHLSALILIALFYSTLLLVPFFILLLRAIISPRRKMTVKQTGIMEIVYAVLLAITVILPYLTAGMDLAASTALSYPPSLFS